MIYLRQSTASQEVPLGPFLDDTDGKTTETALTIANTAIKIWKSGATTLANKNSGGATHISDGVYYAVLDATDTNTTGSLVIFINPTGALPIKVDCVVLDSASYDTMISGTALWEVDVLELGGSVQSATDLKDFADAGYDPATNKIEGVKLVDTTTTNTDMRGTDSAALATALATVDTNVDAILVDTGTTLEGHLTDIKGGTFNGTTDSLEAIRDRGDTAWITGGGGSAPTASEVADAVWDEVLTAHNGAGSAGLALTTSADGIAIDIPATLGSPVTTIAGDIATMDANVDSILDDTGTSGVVLANSAITASKVAANALTNGSFTTGYFNAVNAEVDTALTDYDAATGAEVATVDAKVTSVKAKTDSLTFTKTGEVDANTQSINGVTITGDGSATPFDV